MSRNSARGPASAGRRKAAPVVLAIAASDPSAGAGIQADLRTLEAFGVNPATVVTAITVQTGAQFFGVHPLSPRLVEMQLRRVLSGLPVAAVKCGVLARASIVAVIAKALAPRRLPMVVDPVLRASAGGALAEPGLAAAIAKKLFPLASLVTVNLEEAALFAAMPVADVAAMKEAARRIVSRGARAVLVKGGHLSADPVDVLCYGRRSAAFSGSRLGDGDMHGSGCALASAVAAGLARHWSLGRSVEEARRHVRALIAASVLMPSGARLRQPLGSDGVERRGKAGISWPAVPGESRS